MGAQNAGSSAPGRSFAWGCGWALCAVRSYLNGAWRAGAVSRLPPARGRCWVSRNADSCKAPCPLRAAVQSQDATCTQQKSGGHNTLVIAPPCLLPTAPCVAPALRTKRRGKVTVEGRTFSVVEYEPDENGNSLIEVIIDGERRVLGVGDHEEGIIEATEVLWDHHGLGE